MHATEEMGVYTSHLLFRWRDMNGKCAMKKLGKGVWWRVESE